MKNETVNEIKFSSPKYPVPEKRSDIYFIACSCNLAYIEDTRRRPKTWVDEHCYEVKNENIYSSSISSHC